ncbi:MAG: hypothetical protein U0572_08590 [Phycisphaerales bacterium]
MNNRSLRWLIASTVFLGGSLVADVGQQGAPATPPKQEVHVSPIPATPAAIQELVYARPFTLDQSYVHDYRREKPQVDAGYIIVVRADSDLLRPRQVAQPVLMVGAQVAEPINIGYASGMLVAIVPAPKKADGTVDLDLSKTPIYFGQPDLPETIDQARAEAQRRFAEQSGIKVAAADAVQTARTRGGEIAKLANREALDHLLGALVRTYAADETQRADDLEGKIDSTPRIVK